MCLCVYNSKVCADKVYETVWKCIISTKFLYILKSARALITSTQYITILLGNAQRNSFTHIYIKFGNES